MQNVILITIDALRRDAVGCYGNPKGLSPFIDSLAARSLCFARAQAVGPYTQASFPGILTSSYYLDKLDHGKGSVLSADRTLVSEVLQRAGIATAAFHSNAYLCEAFGWNRGWDTFYDSMDAEVTDEVPYIKGDGINRKAEEWLAGRSRSVAPFFLWVHYMDIHEPYIPPRRYIDLVDSSINLTSAGMFALFSDVLLKRDVSNPAAVETLRKLYEAHVRETDDFVRDFFALFQMHNVLGDSVIILTSDHGDEFGEHGGLSHDGKMTPELLDVPLLIHDPAGPRAEVCEKLVSNVDIPPTILHLFGLPPEARFLGRSLLPSADYPDRAAFAECIGKRGRQKETDRPVYSCRQGSLRVVFDEASGGWELFDVEADPTERRNIVGSSPHAEGMRRELLAHINSSAAERQPKGPKSKSQAPNSKEIQSTKSK